MKYYSIEEIKKKEHKKKYNNIYIEVEYKQ